MPIASLGQCFGAIENPRCCGEVEHRLLDILVIAAGLQWELVGDLERREEFGAAFAAAARAVIHGNAQRAGLKRLVNAALGSRLVEEKSYAQ